MNFSVIWFSEFFEPWNWVVI